MAVTIGHLVAPQTPSSARRVPQPDRSSNRVPIAVDLSKTVKHPPESHHEQPRRESCRDGEAPSARKKVPELSTTRDAELVAIAQELFGHGASVALRREEGLLTEITVMWLGDRLDNDSSMVGILNEFQSELPGRVWERSSDVLRRSAHFVRRSRPRP